MKLTTKIYKSGNYYVARVPELGVTTQGKTMESAKRNLREALSLHIRSMVDYAIKHGSIRVEHGQLVKIKE